MLNELFLKDDFCISGTDITDFRNTVTEVANKTTAEKISTSELKVLSYKGTSPDQEYLSFYTMDAGHPWRDDEAGCLTQGKLKAEKILCKGKFQPVIDEMSSGVKTMLMKDDSNTGKSNIAYFISSGAFDTMGSRAGLRGDALFDHCLERNILLSKCFGKAIGDNATLIVREIMGCRKIMAMFSEKYSYVPQTCLIDILDQLSLGPLGDYSCNKWYISHDVTQIWIEFPKKSKEMQQVYGLKDELIFGLYLATSDNGSSSLKAIGTWRINNSVSYDTRGIGDESDGVRGSRKHICEVDTQAFCDKADKEIFSKMTKLPEALCNLMLYDVTDPSWTLQTGDEQKNNRAAIVAAIKSCFGQIGMVAAIGKSSEKMLLELVCQEINPTLHYTGYDVATLIMSLAGRVDGLSKTAETQLAFAIAKAPYCKFGKPAAPALVLTA